MTDESVRFEARSTSSGSKVLAGLEVQRRNRIERRAEEARQLFESYSEKIPFSLVSAIKDRKAQFCVFLGAGAVKSAGLPSGDELRDIVLKEIYGDADFESRFREEFRAYVSKEQEVTLEMVVQALQSRFGNKAYGFLKNFVDNDKIPPEGYSSLMNLVRNGFFNVILTTNFDQILERALDNAIGGGKYTRICTLDDFKSYVPQEEIDRVRLIKLHGTYTLPSTLAASWSDIQELPLIKAEFLNYYSSYFVVIFVGYSGRDPDTRKTLQKASCSKRTRIFWVSPDLKRHASEILDWFDSDGNHIPMTSDEFFSELEYRLLRGEPRLENEVNSAIFTLGASDEDTAVDAFQIAAGILEWNPEVRRHCRGSLMRLIRDVAASCEALLKKGRLDGYVGNGMKRRYWD